MSKVALRVYNRDIETLIDQGHIDEAIAHCQHVLKIFPKYLEIYRLLGKAYLEARRFSDAADIFQRVLLAVPDDFISHLGMSIVSDEQKDLDRAIWHMERAYEISPSNAGVQNELRRLYGRRDGLEPPKIRLTRGALAQMYNKGGQYQQAIVEIKSVLAEDPTRNDLKTLLARAYFRAGMKVEATEICTELLRRYPYNLDANRILVDILPGTSLAGSVEQYKKRVQALDPYASLVTGSLFEVDNVPDAAVSVERLEYDVAAQETSWQPVTQTPVAPAIQPSAENLPDWMRQAGWGPSTGEFQEGPVNFDEPEPPAASAPLSGLAEAEIPDWLKAMAPPSVSEPADEAPAAEDLDWLASLGGPLAGSVSAQQPAAPAPTADEAVPDWLSGLGAPQQEKPAEPQTAPPAEVPDWLSGLGESQPESLPVESALPAEETIPDWLSGLGESQPQPSAAESNADWLTGLVPPAQESVPQPEPVADWLKDLTPAAEEQPLSALASGPGTSESEQDEALKWLESLAARQGAKPEELLTRPEERIEALPDWIEQVGQTPSQPAPSAPAPYIPEKPIEIDAEPFQGQLSPVSKAPGTGPLEQDDALKWLESLAEKQGAKPEELITPPESRRQSAPAWLGEVQNPPTELSAPVFGPGTSEAEQDDALKWLESLAARQGAKPEELLTKPEERREELPDWIARVGEEPVSGPQAEALPWEMTVEPGEQALPEESAPSAVEDWLSSLEATAQEPPALMPWEQQAPIEPVVETSAESLPWEIPAEAATEESLPWEVPAEAPAEPVSLDTSAVSAPAESFPWESATEETPAEPLPWEVPVTEAPAGDARPISGAESEAEVTAWLESLEEQRPTPPETPVVAETEELPDWLRDMSADEEAPAPASVSEWKPVEESPLGQEVAVEAVPQAKSALEEKAAEQTPLRLRSTSSLQDKEAAIINSARNLLENGKLDDAMTSYSKLIKKGKLLEEVIEDLNEIVYRHPVDVIVWQTMGDAYMRSNRLQEALDAYTKAEELLRR